MGTASSTQVGSAQPSGAAAADGAGPSRVSISTPSLPLGGGAIRDIGEKFTTNPATGTGSMEVPIPTSPGRSGFGPRLSLSYDSGSGNGVFGLGWSLSLPSVTRKTDKGLPTYYDGAGSVRDSDVFVLSGSEDLVPDGADDDVDTAPDYAIRRYRPRVDRLFARIERWTRRTDGDVHWRSISSDNVLTVYGLDDGSRLADPDNAGRVFSWLISETRDDRGNGVVFNYKPDDDTNVDLGRPCERHRGDGVDPRRRNNRYLKSISYGNRSPLLDGTGHRPRFLADLAAGPAGLAAEWMFEVVLDYGEHDADAPAPDDDGPWGYRADPFSSYRSGFELRSTRLCRRILMFHHVPPSPAHGGAPARIGYDGLVSSTDLGYKVWPEGDDAVGAPYACLTTITRTGYRRAGAGYVRRSLPPIEFEYTEPVVQHTVHDVTATDLGNLPPGAFGSQSRPDSTGPLHHWIDLHGDGIPGVLTEQADTWCYARNLSPLSTDASFAATSPVALKPNAALGDGFVQFTDLAGDGRMDLVVFDGPQPGLYEHDDQDGWKPFRHFTSRLNRDISAANTEVVDLDGDGSADVLVIEENAFVWHPSLGEAGFGPGLRIARPPDDDTVPQLLTSNETHAVHFADFTGDGLADLVRIGNGEVCYWPNVGYGRFGRKVTMDGLSPFDTSEAFDPRRVLLADIDGSGTADVIYLHGDGVRLYFNSCGNGFGRPTQLDALPGSDDMASITALDLLGNGTTCLVWVPSGPGDGEQPLRYVNLVGATKPHLLSRTVNNLGAETIVRYAPSTKFSLADRRSGHPWVSRLPFPVHVVEQVTTLDRINRNRFVTRYAYHDGHFDGEEREFCGFGSVDQWDVADIGAFGGSEEPEADVDVRFPEQFGDLAPVLTRSWFHTGTGARRFPETTVRIPALPQGLSGSEQREAQRATRGMLLRQEAYGLDGSEREQHPYLIAEFTTAVELVQSRGDGQHAVFTTHPVETLEQHLERDPADPRLQQEVVLEVDPFGNVLKSVSIAYGRKPATASAALAQPADQTKQTTPLIVYTETTVTEPITDSATFPADHRTPLQADVRRYELTDYPAAGPGGRYQPADFVELDLAHPGRLRHVFDDEVGYEQDPAGPRCRRLIDWARTRYRANDLTALLNVGGLQSRALPGESYQLAFTKPLLEKVFRRDGTDLLPDPSALLAGSRGGYTIDDDDRWWVASGRAYLSPAAPGGADVAAATEFAYAVDHFFLPCRTRDSFHTATASTELAVTYDDHDLLVVETRDAVGNRVAVDVDYRVLQPYRITDPNGNVGEVAFDALGAVTATATIGKPGQLTGDSLAGLNPDPSADDLAAYFAAPLTDPEALLGSATTRFVYDLDAYRDSVDEAHRRPAAIGRLAREKHVAQLAGANPVIQQVFSYSDGFGRVVQEKVRGEPGPLEDGAPAMDPRWIATGWTVYDAKGMPTRRFEPFFTSTTVFEFGITKGVSPVVFYDPMGRATATLYPDDTYEKVTFGPWQQSTFDRNDTVLTDIRSDADVAGLVEGFFAARASEPGPPWQTWYQRRQAAPPASPQREAATKAAAHADTPTIAHFDALGRVFLTQIDNGPDPDDPGEHALFEARLDLDIRGNQRAVRDADRQGDDPLGRVVVQQTHDALGRVVLGHSMETGSRWTLTDATGKPLSTWDSRGRHTRTDYDPLRRPLRTVVSGFDVADPDRHVVSERLIYGEQHPQAAQNNLRGAVYLHLDQAGATVIEARDVKSNVLRTGRRLTGGTAYRDVVDWEAVDQSPALPASARDPFDADGLEAALAAILDDDLWLVRTTYDALDRQVTTTSPHLPGMRRSVVRPRWNTANLVDGIDVDLRSDPDDAVTPPNWTPFVTNIDYDAQGRRIRVGHGNGVLTSMKFDPFTSRLINVVTTRGGDRLQDVSYVRDPVGNITHKTDAAQQSHFFANQVVTPGCGFTYDATYRLVEATGREHLGLAGNQLPHSPHDELRCLLPHPGDGSAMAGWTEQYLYDSVGNLQMLKHIGTNAGQPGWTRHYVYTQPSAIEDGVGAVPAKMSNRLSGTTLDDGPGAAVEEYLYDVHGNTVRMPHLGGPAGTENLRWGLRDDLVQADLGGGGTAYYVYGADGHRVRKVWEKAAGLVEERIYLGGFEIFRRTQPGQRLERESLHVMDGEQRVALIETRTVDTAGTDAASAELVRYQYGDELGSAAVELDDSARIISYEEYAPFGSTTYQAVASATETPKRYRYTGKERDEETGFTYHGARYCAPWLGRWVSPDPAGLRTGPNVYVYVKNNPVGLVDPDGAEDTPAPAQKELGLGQKIGIGLSLGFTLATGQTPEHFGKGMLDKAHSLFVKPVLTIYGPDGMIDKAAQKGVDRAMGVQKPDEEYVTKQQHKDQLDAIIAIGSALFPGVKVSLPKAPAAAPQLATAGAAAGGGGGMSVGTVAVADASISVVASSATRSVALAAAGAARIKSGRPQWWFRNVRESQITASTKGFQVYVLKDASGKVLYVGKSGGAAAEKPLNWLGRVRSHITDTAKADWIGEVDQITVTSELTEMEAFALEEDLIHQTATTNRNISQGEFSVRFRGSGRAENVQSAMKKPSFNFEVDIVR